MIVVDTMVLSELTMPRPEPNVVHWFRRFGPELALPTVVISELYYGVEIMNDVDRKRALKARYAVLVNELRDRIIVFDEPAAMEFAVISAETRRSGAEMKTIDAQIAAIARAKRSPVATRDSDFRKAGVKVINPWEDS